VGSKQDFLIMAGAGPTLGDEVYVSPTAVVCGDVSVGDQTTIMHHVVIRGDIARITIGRRVNIQDGSVVHTAIGEDLVIEDEVSVGHRAVVHCARVGRGALVGIGAVVLDGADLGEGCMVGAGAVVPPGMRVSPGWLVMGVPARPVREIGERERLYLSVVVDRYVELGRLCRSGAFPSISSREPLK
jgi:gamma-carbonic anhydrase